MLESATLWSLVEARARATPSALMAVDARDREIRFDDFRDHALATARSLHAKGIGPGRTVSWMLPTRLESMLLIAALARLGVRQNPILPIYRRREVAFIVAQCQPDLLVTPAVWRGFDYPAMAREIAADCEGLETLVVDTDLPEDTAGPLPEPPGEATAEEPPIRWLFYTSGTTSEPKGVQHTDASLWAAARGMGRALDLRASDRVAFVFPCTHIGGINWLQAGLAWGCAQILIENFADASTIPALRRHGVTLAAAGTVFHEAYLEAQRRRAVGTKGPASEASTATADGRPAPLFPAVRAFPGGGAPKPPRLHRDLKRELGGVGILSGYGMTEAPILSMARPDDPDEKLAKTEGRPVSAEVDLRVVRADGHLARPGEEGEFRVRAPQLFRGYVDSALDHDAFDEAGCFRTGDLGYLDEAGYVVVTGRLKDVIIRKGENIPAREIEDLLHEHPKVADVAVIGLPDPRTGERCCAVVVSSDVDDPLDMAEMARFLRERGVMVQKIPEQLESVDSIPRNATGKILKHELRARHARKAGD